MFKQTHHINNPLLNPRSLLIGLMVASLSACVSSVWTGASIAYDRHNVYKKVSDFQLGANANRALFLNEMRFKCPDCMLDVAALNGDLLLSGHLPSSELRDEAARRMQGIEGVRRFFNQISVSSLPSNRPQDAWITAKVRSQIFADSNINPEQFKVVTSDGIVYLMGDVIPEEADRVIQIARACHGVKRVVKLMRYYNLSDSPATHE